MIEKSIFNYKASDSLDTMKIIGGESTGLINMINSKYVWANKLYKLISSRFWLPERVGLDKDRLDYNNLNPKEQETFKSILSFLAFLDSVQVADIPKISDFITAPEVNICLSAQEFFEVIHSTSYDYIVKSIIPINERHEVSNLWRTNNVLFERNSYIASIYQEFWDKKDDKSFARALIANYILESLYFYNGFIFFYNLAERGKMNGTADIIRLINRDEVDHIDLFANIILTIQQENPNFFDIDMIKEMFDFACNEEIEWFNYILKDSDILGMNINSTEKYTKYLVNKRLEKLGIEKLYIGFDENPYASLELQSDESSEGMKGNFFDSKVSNYLQASSLSGWDDI